MRTGDPLRFSAIIRAVPPQGMPKDEFSQYVHSGHPACKRAGELLWEKVKTQDPGLKCSFMFKDDVIFISNTRTQDYWPLYKAWHSVPVFQPVGFMPGGGIIPSQEVLEMSVKKARETNDRLHKVHVDARNEAIQRQMDELVTITENGQEKKVPRGSLIQELRVEDFPDLMEVIALAKKELLESKRREEAEATKAVQKKKPWWKPGWLSSW